MEIVTIQPSFEPCTQAGWQGYDVTLSQPVTEEDLEQLGKKGHLDYYRQLRQPFFRVIHPQWIIRGVVGRDKLRIGLQSAQGRQEHFLGIEDILESGLPSP